MNQTIYTYNGTLADGQAVRGTVRAPDQSVAAALLARMNIAVGTLAPAADKLFGAPALPARTADGNGGNWPIALPAGLPQALAWRWSTQLPRPRSRLTKALAHIHADLEAGMAADAVLAKHRRALDPPWAGLLETAAATGHLPETLALLNAHAELEQDLRAGLHRPLHLAMVFAAVMVGGPGMLFMTMGSSYEWISGAGSSGPPGGLLWIAHMIPPMIFILSAAVLVLPVTAVILLRGRWGREWRQRLVGALPVFGAAQRAVSAACWASAASTALAAGLDGPAALDFARSAGCSPPPKNDRNIFAADIRQSENADSHQPALRAAMASAGAFMLDPDLAPHASAQATQSAVRHLWRQAQIQTRPLLPLVQMACFVVTVVLFSALLLGAS